MSPERITSAQRGLEIHVRSYVQVSEGRERQGLTRQVRIEALPLDADHRHTATLHANTVADGGASEIEPVDTDRKSRVACARLARADTAYVLNDTGKHAQFLVASSGAQAQSH